MGSSALVACQGKKLSQITVLYTQNAASNPENVGVFKLAFNLANYEYKFVKPAEEAKQGDDPRSKKKTRKVDNIDFLDEKAILGTDAVKFYDAVTAATERSRDVANLRGSHGTPDFIREQITTLVSGF